MLSISSIEIIEKHINEYRLCSTAVPIYKIPGILNKDITIKKLINLLLNFNNLKK